MSQEDFYHQCVRRALVTAGWTILKDQFDLPLYDSKVSIDLAIERTVTDGKKEVLFVEVKNFRKRKDYFNEFQKALGQYLLYREVIVEADILYLLYLAIPKEAHESFFQDEVIQRLLNIHQIKLVVFDPLTETIVQWIP